MGKHKVSSNVLQLNTVKKKKAASQVQVVFRENRSEIGKEKRPFSEDMLTFKFSAFDFDPFWLL